MIKKVKYENKINNLKSPYWQYYLYFAQKTKKNTLHNVKKLLAPFNISLIPFHKEQCLLTPLKDQIPWDLYTMSSTMYLGFPMLSTSLTMKEHWKIVGLPTKPLILIIASFPNFVYDKYRNKMISSPSSYAPFNVLSPNWIDELMRPKNWNPKIPYFKLYDLTLL